MKPMTEKHLAILRRHMVEMIGIHYDLLADELGRERLPQRLEQALRAVPRHHFVPPQLALLAYQDTPLPIGFNKTISQPFLAALMVDLLEPRDSDVVLEVGTGFGYQTAVLASLVSQVWTIEIVEEFAEEAKARLAGLKIGNVDIRVGDGCKGWSEHAPFEKILISAAARRPPPALLDQLAPGGRMILPLGSPEEQRLAVVEKDRQGDVTIRDVLPVRFTELEIA